MPQLQLLVGGRVQGVGYRWFCRSRAEQHGVQGTVRNLADGTVAIVAEGEHGALAAFHADVLRGPLAARVEAIQERWGECTHGLRGFEILG